MRRIVLVLELSEDEAVLVTDAVSQTPVRFTGFPLGEMLGMLGLELGSSKSSDQVSYARSDGADYLGNTPLDVTRLFDGK